MRVVLTLFCIICFAAFPGEWVFAQNPEIDVTPSSADFDVIDIGDQRERSFAISNSDTTETLIVFAVDIRGQDADQFQLLGGSGGFVLQPGELNLVTIRFSPTSPGNKSAVLRIESNDPDESPLGIPLTGIGRGFPDIALVQNALNFGDAVVNSSTFQNLVVFNQGFDDLVIEQAQILGDNLDLFALEEGVIPRTIETGGQDTLRVRFMPASDGVKRGILRLLSNDPDESLLDVALNGRGVRPQIILDSLSYDYGVNLVGDSTVFTFFVSNVGDADLVIDSLVFRGQDANQFRAALQANSLIVRQGETLELPIAYVPRTSGDHVVVLSLYSNDPERPRVDISLRGEAKSPALSANTSVLDFGVLLTNGLEKSESLTLSNNGVVNLVIDSLSIRGDNADQFSFFEDVPSYIVRPEETAKILVVYSPTNDGAHEAVLTLDTNDPEFDSLVVSLSGYSESLQVETNEQAEFEKDFIVNVVLPEGFVPSEGQLIYRSADSFEYISANLSTDSDGVRGLIPGLAVGVSGIEYYVQIRGGDDGFVTLPLAEPLERPIYVPTYIEQYTPSLPLSNWTYQMISVPVILSDSNAESVLMDDYGPYSIRRWRLFRWENDEYEEYPDITGEFQRGKGFWLITNDGAPFDIDDGVSVDPVESFDLVLQPGWNQVGNPFSYPIPWLGETVDPRIGAPVAFNGLEFVYNQVNLMPWEGYFVQNLADEPITISLIRRAIGIGKQGVQKPDGKLYQLQLIIELDEGSVRDSQNFLGFAEEASDKRDAHDFNEAPPIGSYVRMSIIEEGERYAGNFKPSTENGKYWDLEVDASFANTSAQVFVQSDGELPENYEIYILDRDKRTLIEMVDSTFSIDLGNPGSIRNLRVLLGTEQFADQNREDIPLESLESKLEQNYPNPFSESTAIRYAISEESYVRLEVFNLMGQRVLTVS